MGKEQFRDGDEKLNLYRRNCGDEVVFIDAWCPGADENKAPEEKLLPGEILAFTFQVSCYTVRNALRVYTIHDPDWYLSDPEAPAEKEEVEMVRKDLMWDKGNEKDIGTGDSIFAAWGNNGIYAGSIPSWRDKLRVTHEISAKHNSALDRPFTYICRASDPMNGRWFEYIGDIFAVKERDDVPDESVFLLIYLVCTSDFCGTDTWYRFDPDGKVTAFASDLINLDRS